MSVPIWLHYNAAGALLTICGVLQMKNFPTLKCRLDKFIDPVDCFQKMCKSYATNTTLTELKPHRALMQSVRRHANKCLSKTDTKLNILPLKSEETTKALSDDWKLCIKM